MKNKKGNLIIASLLTTIVNAIIVGGVMLHGLFKLPLILSMLQVGFGQFVVITIIGVPLFKFLNNKYSKLLDRKSTRLNSSHVSNSYAVFCLKKNTIMTINIHITI